MTYTPNKIIELEPLFEDLDEPRVILLDAWRGRLEKYAYAASDALDFASTIQPCQGKRYVLVLSVSASEYYGPNRNGDAFSEGEILGPGGMVLVGKKEALPYHYDSFERHGTVFKHHVNKDPDKGYGKPIKAFYNWRMHRVELLLELDVQKAQGQFFLEKIESGESPGVSMGCHIQYDVCAICGNRAPTRKQYCEHVNNRHSDYGMNRLLADGRQCYVYNPNPRFFDISFVWRPADPNGYMLKKVAHTPYALSFELAEKVHDLQDKRAELQKVSDIAKQVGGDIIHPTLPAKEYPALDVVRETLRSIKNDTPGFNVPMSANLAQETAHLPLPVITSNMLASGIVPTAQDMYVMICARQKSPADPRVVQIVGNSQGLLAEVLQDFPELLQKLQDHPAIANSTDYLSEGLVKKIAQEMPGRSLATDALMRKYVPESVGMPLGTLAGAPFGYDPTQAYYGRSMQRLTYRDPRSGKRYETNRQAAEQADLSNKKKLVAEGAGLAALLGTAYKSFTAGGKLRKFMAPAAAAGGAYLGYDVMKGQRVPRIQTEQGEYIPANTELIEKRSGMSFPSDSSMVALSLAQDNADTYSVLNGCPDLSKIAADLSSPSIDELARKLDEFFAQHAF